MSQSPGTPSPLVWTWRSAGSSWWRCWNGRRWDRNDHKALAWAMDLSDQMLKEALDLYGETHQLQADALTRFAEIGDDEDKEAVTDARKAVKKAGAYLAHAKNLRGATRLRNMMELSQPALVLKADKLDANPFDLNTPAGIVNLTTGELRSHDRCAYCGQITEASPGEAGRKMWEDFLHTTTCGDGSVQGFLQLVSGMALVGTVYQEGIVIACGGGSWWFLLLLFSDYKLAEWFNLTREEILTIAKPLIHNGCKAASFLSTRGYARGQDRCYPVRCQGRH